nr:hypothetical protein [uncultured Desulfobulbus sp.]
MGKNVVELQTGQPIQISLPATRKGLLGKIDLGHDYMIKIDARAKALQKATKIPRGRR